MKRLLSFLIILALVVFVGFKAGAWWLADQRLAEARTALSEVGVLQRGNISSALDGRLLLKQAGWQDFRLTQPLELGLVELDTGSPVSLLTALMYPEPLPSDWQLKVEQASMVLEPVMFRNWVTAGAEAEDAPAPLVVLSCAPDPRQQLGSGDLTRMGIDAIRGDLLLIQDSEGLHAELNTVDTGSLEVHWPGARLQLLDSELTLAGAQDNASVTLRDGGLMRRLSAYCGRETGLTVNEWAGKAATALDAGLRARGYQASDQLVALYRQWLTEGGELVFPVAATTGTPDIPVRTEDNPEAAWPVTYNGATVPDVYLTTIEVVEPPLPAEAMEPVAVQEEPGKQGWYEEDSENASDWIGRQVRITLSNGNQLEGRLDIVGEREMDITRSVGGGEVSYPILIRAISQFEVWRRGRAD